MQRIVPHAWCNRTNAAAAELYCAALPNTSVINTLHYPTTGLPEFQESFAGEPVVTELDIAGFKFALINAGDTYRPTPALNLMLNFDPANSPAAEEQLRHAWKTFMQAGATELMPLGEYAFSPLYAWVEDPYGVSWQLMLTNPQGEPRPFVIPSFLFGGPAQNQAQRAIETYLRVFPDSQMGTLVPWAEATGPAEAGSVLFADFQLCGQWFTAMDSGAETEFTFTPGMSLMLLCDTQEEIDAAWEQLSAVPEAEQCGWLIDEFGVSWQIAPAQYHQLLEKPGAYTNMMQMKKLIIDKF